MSDLGIEMAGYYREIRGRFSSLIGSLSAEELATEVPGCPGWTVRDTFCHVVSNPADGLAGELSGPPDDEYTAGQIARAAGSSIDELIDSWAENGAKMDPVIEMVGDGIAPIVIDAYVHEQDILGALGRVGHREGAVVEWVAARLRDQFGSPIPMDDFEVTRARLGRRSAAQVAAAPWDGQPDLDAFFIFGPRDTDLVE